MNKLSVIIPTYNRAKIVHYTLDSVLPIHHPKVELEVIVVDDGSTDGTVEIVTKNYPHVKFFHNPGKGAPAARNFALTQATGDYVVYVDSDDLVGPNYFHKKLAALSEHTESNACYGEYEFFESDKELTIEAIEVKEKYPLHTNSNSDLLHVMNYLEGRYIPNLAIIWRKSILVSCQGQDESLTVNQDVDQLLRGLFAGLNMISVVDGSKVYVRSHRLDPRVGDAGRTREKWLQILRLRKFFFNQLVVSKFDTPESRDSLGKFMFKSWREVRQFEPDIADSYLEFAKESCWPSFSKLVSSMVKSNLVYGAKDKKGIEKMRHYLSNMPDYLKYSERFDLKELVYYHVILFLPFLLRAKKH